MYPTYMYLKGLYFLKSFSMGFGYFCPKIYAIFLGVSPLWVTLKLLFGKKYRTLGIMKHEMRNEMK